MLLHKSILFGTLFICTSLNMYAMWPRFPDDDEPLTRITLYYHKDIFYDHPITYALFFTRMMLEEEIIVTDIRNRILQYCIYLKNKDFLEKFPYQKTWLDLCIPVQYQYLLTSQQLNTLGNVFRNTPKEIALYTVSRNNGHKEFNLKSHNLYYLLPSKKDYELFLQLPIAVRICLTQLPTDPTKINKTKEILVLNSSRIEYHKKPNPYPPNDINKKKEILVLNSNRTEYHRKPMLPEQKKTKLLTFKKHKNSKNKKNNI
jgi:hypothetical protein